MKYGTLSFLLLATIALVWSYAEPPKTFEAKLFTTWSKRHVNGSRLGEIFVPLNDDQSDFIKVKRLDLVGGCKARGYAQGALLAADIAEFMGPKLTKYFADEILNIDISNYPEPLLKILEVLKIKGAIVAPQVFRQAMG